MFAAKTALPEPGINKWKGVKRLAARGSWRAEWLGVGDVPQTYLSCYNKLTTINSKKDWR